MLKIRDCVSQYETVSLLVDWQSQWGQINISITVIAVITRVQVVFGCGGC